MTIWRIDVKVVPLKGDTESAVNTFYLECDSSEVEKQAMEIIGVRKGHRVNLTFGPLTTPRKSAANRYPAEGIWLGGLDTNDIFVYSEEFNA